MTAAQYSFPSDAEQLAKFTEEHINRRHTVVTAGRHMLTCMSCSRLAPVPEPGTAAGYLQQAKRKVRK